MPVQLNDLDIIVMRRKNLTANVIEQGIPATTMHVHRSGIDPGALHKTNQGEASSTRQLGAERRASSRSFIEVTQLMPLSRGKWEAEGCIGDGLLAIKLARSACPVRQIHPTW